MLSWDAHFVVWTAASVEAKARCTRYAENATHLVASGGAEQWFALRANRTRMHVNLDSGSEHRRRRLPKSIGGSIEALGVDMYVCQSIPAEFY